MLSVKAYAFVLTFSFILPRAALIFAERRYPALLRSTPPTVALLVGSAYVWVLLKWTVPFLLSPLNHLPSPGGASFLLGHGPSMISRPPGVSFLRFMKTVPNNGLIHFRGFFQLKSRLLATTPEVLTEVLNNKAYDYEKPAPARKFLSRVLGHGLIIVEGQEHKVQRKSVTPAFQGKHIKDLVPTFWAKATQLTAAIAAKLKSGDVLSKDEARDVIEIGAIASRITLDIIGVAAFSRDFNALHNAEDELVKQYALILEPDKGSLALYFAVNMFVPHWIVQLLPWKMNQLVAGAAANLRLICRQLLADKKAAMEKDPTEHFDILSVLMKSGSFTDDGLNILSLSLLSRLIRTLYLYLYLYLGLYLYLYSILTYIAPLVVPRYNRVIKAITKRLKRGVGEAKNKLL